MSVRRVQQRVDGQFRAPRQRLHQPGGAGADVAVAIALLDQAVAVEKSTSTRLTRVTGTSS
jgi:hypothetical protein